MLILPYRFVLVLCHESTTFKVQAPCVCSDQCGNESGNRTFLAQLQKKLTAEVFESDRVKGVCVRPFLKGLIED